MTPLEQLKAARPKIKFAFDGVTYYLRQPSLRQADEWQGLKDTPDDQQTVQLHSIVASIWCDESGDLVNPTIADIEEAPMGWLAEFQHALSRSIALETRVEKAAGN